MKIKNSLSLSSTFLLFASSRNNKLLRSFLHVTQLLLRALGKIKTKRIRSKNLFKRKITLTKLI